ncbi:MAG: hypothetical protein WAK10_01115, partial [Methanoregula sp.]
LRSGICVPPANGTIRFFAGIFRLPVLVWTVRDPETAKKFREAGQNCIFEGFDSKKDLRNPVKRL